MTYLKIITNAFQAADLGKIEFPSKLRSNIQVLSPDIFEVRDTCGKRSEFRSGFGEEVSNQWMVLGRSEEGFNFEESFPPEVREGRIYVTEGPSHLGRSLLGDSKKGKWVA